MSDDLYDGPCEAGCISFHGGERKHHKDCGHYPHSLTKVNADRIEKLEAKLDLSEGALDVASRSWGECQRILEQTEAKLAKAVEALDRIQDGSYGKLAAKARTILAELKGEDQ